MEQTGEYRIEASRDDVWAGLNDPDVLARCLEGCQSMNKVADDRFDARVKAKVGPVRATFDAQLTLENIRAPESYTLSANVKGGPAGFARGQAHVRLAEDGDGTHLSYTVEASIGGKLAQVGSRLIDGAARKMADDFFARFREEMGGDSSRSEASGAPEKPAEGPPAAPSGAGGAPAPPTAYESRGNWMIWTAVFVVLLLALVFAL